MLKAGSIEFLTTLIFSTAGAGGVEGIASGAAREQFRRNLLHSASSAWKEGAEAFGVNLLGEMTEEQFIGALDLAFVRMEIHPGMNSADVVRQLQATAVRPVHRGGNRGGDHRSPSSATALDTIADGLTRDLPGTNWRNGTDGVLDAPWAADPALLPDLLPIAISGKGTALHGDHRAATFAAATDTQLRAIGIPEAEALRRAWTSGVMDGADHRRLQRSSPDDLRYIQ